MDLSRHVELFRFYEKELKENILRFWLPRCLDEACGGFVNCFDNRGEKLVSYDKYTWSQGRFVWMFARLASSEADIFSEAERKRFLALSKNGADFLMKHCLMSENDYRCVFLMERDGTPKCVAEGMPLDMSIYADCFVISGLSMYAYASGERECFDFAKKVYESCLERIEKRTFRTLPYPLSDRFRAHGIPMIMSNTTRELLRAAEKFAPDETETLKELLYGFAEDILSHFADEKYVLREILTNDNCVFPQILGQHINPGHTIEDVWFLLDAAEILGRNDWEEKIFGVAKKAMELGWDEQFGGILHFAGVNGGKPEGDDTGVSEETMTKQLSGWADKLWWVHSEALYTLLRCALKTQDEEFFIWHDRVFDYTFRTFPNDNIEIGEWIQIRKRDGSPQDKVVALPVKDPYHITRNLILILELLRAYELKNNAYETC